MVCLMEHRGENDDLNNKKFIMNYDYPYDKFSHIQVVLHVILLKLLK
jgi:hypothetical protein